MNVVLFCHSLRSDWNHGNAHFLRGVASELMRRGHQVRIFEPADAWSAKNLAEDAGTGALSAYRVHYPGLDITTYTLTAFDLEWALDGADVVLMHEWNDPELVRRVGAHRANHAGYRLLFHDTHHRFLTSPEEMKTLDLSGYDAVLAFGAVLRERYAALGWGRRVYVWHEAADTHVFYPRQRHPAAEGLVWVGNFGDEERRRELMEFLVEPVQRLGLAAEVFGVRYPADVLGALERAGVRYSGWVANFDVPELFARFAMTVHVPRGPYAAVLHGIPTIRPFEALACGIPLVSAPWHDTEGLFSPGEDYLVAHSGEEMGRCLDSLRRDPELRAALARRGYATIQRRHTCAHRVNELEEILRQLELGTLKHTPCAAEREGTSALNPRAPSSSENLT
jgi:spore maturation protein CgeB